MKILAVNWLDLRNPQAGGAELHFFEIFKRLVDEGDSVTLVSSGWDGASPREEVEGIDVRRVGTRHSFAWKGRAAIRSVLAEQAFDVIVEDVNKLPLYVANLTTLPCYVIIPHLFGSTAFREASVPLASAVWLSERLIPRLYRRAAYQAISDSTRDDLVRRGVPAEKIRVVYPGTDHRKYRVLPDRVRADRPTFLYLGRLKRYKGVDLTISAFASFVASHPQSRLLIVGNGDDRPRLERLVSGLGISQSVSFLGFVSEEEKVKLLNESWALVFPSDKEGWGLTNVEAAACGTPAIVSNSPGLRESVRDGETGRLVPHGDTSAIARAMAGFAENPESVEELGHGGVKFASKFSWEEAAKQTRDHIIESIHNAGG